jgi:hypothetical protein
VVPKTNDQMIAATVEFVEARHVALGMPYQIQHSHSGNDGCTSYN